MAVPRIIILSEILRGQTYELTEDLYTIGRTENREVCIPDGTISSHHCNIERLEDGTYIAKDMGSTNGTRVNGDRITERVLSNSDILQVGGIEILYDCEDKTSTASLNTQTGIDLTATTGSMDVQQMSTLSPFEDKSGGGKDKSKLIFMVIIGILVLVVVVLIVKLIPKLLQSG